MKAQHVRLKQSRWCTHAARIAKPCMQARCLPFLACPNAPAPCALRCCTPLTCVDGAHDDRRLAGLADGGAVESVFVAVDHLAGIAPHLVAAAAWGRWARRRQRKRQGSMRAGRQAGRRAGGRAGGVSWMVGYQATLTRKSPGTRGRRPRWLPRPSRCPRSCIGSPAHRRLGQADGRRGKRARLGVWDVWLTVRLRQAVLGGGEQARGLAASGLVACLLLPARAAASHPCECSSRRCRRRWRLQRGRRQRAHIS